MNKDDEVFGGWSVDISLFNWIKNNIEEGKTMLEIGSGNSTYEFSKILNVYSIEENIEWVGRYHDRYIYAPIVDGWYDVNAIEKNIPKNVDIILIDGPAHGDRNGFFDNLSIFINLNPYILVFDDIERDSDNKCYINVVQYLKEIGLKIETDIISDNKKFAFIKIIK